MLQGAHSARAAGYHRNGCPLAAGCRQQRTCLQQPRVPRVAAAAQQEPASDFSQVIADVLNQHRASAQPVDLLSALDQMGVGVATTITRTWEASGAELQLKGTWSQHQEARRMAMLAVYQEHMVCRAAAIQLLYDHVTSRHPQLLDATIMGQLERTRATNSINAAVSVLQVPHLTQLAAALVPYPVLQQLVLVAMERAKVALLQQAPYSYDNTQRTSLLMRLAWVQQRLCRGAVFARLRALLCPPSVPMDTDAAQAHHQQQVAAWEQLCAGAEVASRELGQVLTPEQWYYQQQQVQGVPGQRGKVLQASFHTRPLLQQPQQQQVSSTFNPEAALLRAAPGGVAADDELQGLCRELQALRTQERILQNQEGNVMGLMPEVSRQHRALLLDLLATWARCTSALQPPQLPATCLARVAIRSQEMDQMWRRVCIEVAPGPELSVMRRLVVTKGRGFLEHFSPSLGNPFQLTDEWNYFQECPAVWMRFVSMPDIQTTTLKPRSHAQAQAQQQQQQQQVLQQEAAASSLLQTPAAAAAAAAAAAQPADLQQQQQHHHHHEQQQLELTAGELHGLMQVLVAELTAVPSAGAAVPAPTGIQVRRLPAPAGKPGQGSQLQVVKDGQTVLQLTKRQAASVGQLLDDVTSQLPGVFDLGRASMEVTATTPGTKLAGAAKALASAALKAAAAVAVLVLPLLAIARPSKQLQLLDAAAAAGRPTVRLVEQRAPPSSATPAVPSSSHVQQAGGKAAGNLNSVLSQAELEGLCAAMEQRVSGQVWLPVDTPGVHLGPSAGADSTSSSSSSASGSTQAGLPAALSQAVAAVVELSSVPHATPAPMPSSSRAGDVAAGSSSSTVTGQTGGTSSTGGEDRLQYQVLVCRQGQVLGVLPCTPAAAVVLAELPPVSDLRPGVGKAQKRRLEAMAAANPSKKAATLVGDAVGYSPAAYRPLPQDGAAVLSLTLQPCKDTAAGRKVVGSGKGAVELVQMEAVVGPWQDSDSLLMWQQQGAVTQGPGLGVQITRMV